MVVEFAVNGNQALQKINDLVGYEMQCLAKVKLTHIVGPIMCADKS